MINKLSNKELRQLVQDVAEDAQNVVNVEGDTSEFLSSIQNINVTTLAVLSEILILLRKNNE